jgi:hypothetical protein
VNRWRRYLSAISLVVSPLVVNAGAQRGMATPNYYPRTYSGDTFTGRIVDVEDDTIRLEYRHGNKADTFEGTLEAPCKPPGARTGRTAHASELPNDGVVTVLYTGRSVKDEKGQKKHVNTIIGLVMVEGEGKKIAEADRKLIYCTDTQQLVFKAF